MGGGCPHARLERNSLHPGVCFTQQLVGAVLNPTGHIGISRATVGRVVLESTVFGRVVRGRNYDSVGEMLFTPAVVSQNGVRNRWGGGNAVVGLNDGFYRVGRE